MHENPYQSPQTTPSRSAFSDRLLARRMLETREHGFSFGLFARRSAKRYLLLFTIHGLALAMLALMQIWPLFCLLLGLTTGCLLRDLGWVRNIGRTWPFSEKVTDWTKVQELAEL